MLKIDGATPQLVPKYNTHKKVVLRCFIYILVQPQIYPLTYLKTKKLKDQNVCYAVCYGVCYAVCYAVCYGVCYATYLSTGVGDR